MSKAKEEELARVENSLKTFTEHRDKLRQELGIDDGGGGMTPQRLRAEEDTAAAFNKMTPREIMLMYESDREGWKAMMDQVQSAGERKLFGKKW